jgi:hypothetical protein
VSEMQGVEHPADGSMSETVWNDFFWELCNGTLTVQSYGTYNTGEHRVRITNKLDSDWTGDDAEVVISWEQWEDFVEAIRERTSQKIVETESEWDRFRGGLSL